MIYTAICGGFDPPRTDIKCFTENGHFTSHRMGAKLYKILPHLFMPESPVTIYVDGNIIPLAKEDEIVSELLPGDSNIGCFTHPWRPTVQHEISECLRLKFMKENEATQLRHFLGEQTKTLPLCECGILARRNTPEVNQFNNLWWSLLCRFSERDQVTFPFAVSSSPGIKLNVVKTNLRNHRMFKFSYHPSDLKNLPPWKPDLSWP